MPIVFIHGVATRRDDPAYVAGSQQRTLLLRRYVAPAIAPDPENVAIHEVYWGDHGVRFAWAGASRPRTPLTGQGAAAAMTPLEQTMAAALLRDSIAALPPTAPAAPAVPASGGLVAAGPAAAASSPAAAPPLRLADLHPAELSDLLATILTQSLGEQAVELTAALLAADAVAHDRATFHELAQCRASAAERAVLERLLAERYAVEPTRPDGLAGMGTPAWLQRAGDRLGEALDRGANLGGFALTRAAVELQRRSLNDLLTLFFGDVLTYINTRGDAADPGPIPRAALETLRSAAAGARRRAGEPLVVLSHSMGGQITYDLVTHFLPEHAADSAIRVDFWCATASQVGLFEEMKLFKASSPQYSSFQGNLAPLPDRRWLGGWWNVWDHNDLISYTVRGIFPTRPAHPQGVDDEAYDSGMFALPAHGGYLDRPSFYRRFAAKLQAARAGNWGRP